jgi:hypothetical protein
MTWWDGVDEGKLCQTCGGQIASSADAHSAVDCVEALLAQRGELVGAMEKLVPWSHPVKKHFTPISYWLRVSMVHHPEFADFTIEDLTQANGLLQKVRHVATS